VPGARHLSLTQLAGELMVLVGSDTGVLLCISGEGLVRWRDSRAVAALSGPPQMVSLDGDTNLQCVTTSEDWSVRVLELGSVLAPPRMPKEAFTVSETASLE